LLEETPVDKVSRGHGPRQQLRGFHNAHQFARRLLQQRCIALQVGTVPDQVRQWIPGRYVVLGTDGFGRSDARAALRGFFEVDRYWITVAALKALADEGQVDVATVKRAMDKFGLDASKPNPPAC